MEIPNNKKQISNGGTIKRKVSGKINSQEKEISMDVFSPQNVKRSFNMNLM